MIKYSHVFEIELNGEKSWIIVREDITGNAVLYSISDSDKVLTGIKRSSPIDHHRRTTIHG